MDEKPSALTSFSDFALAVHNHGEWTDEVAVYPDAGQLTAREAAYLALGVAGEAIEAYNARSSDDELFGELGDLLWYASRIARFYGSNYLLLRGAILYSNDPERTIKPQDGGTLDARILEYAGKIAESFKKAVRKQPLEAGPFKFEYKNVQGNISDLDILLYTIFVRAGLGFNDPRSILEANKEKLLKRKAENQLTRTEKDA